MKNLVVACLLVLYGAVCFSHPPTSNPLENEFQRIQIESRVAGLNLSLLHLPAYDQSQGKSPVLFIHGASFPSALAFGFRMENYSWMDDLARQGYQTFALDHLGYGESDRYPKMSNAAESRKPLGTGRAVVFDIERAVKYVLKRTGAKKIHLIGHSWGATVSGYYATLHPEQIQKLVLFAPFVAREGPVDWPGPDHPYLELTPERRVQQFFTQLPYGQDTVLDHEVLEKWGETWLSSDKASKEERREFVRYPAGWKKDLYDCWNRDCLFEPEKITVSTLIIRGEWDTSFSWNDARWLFENLSMAASKRYVVIEKSTHVIHLEKSRDQLYDQVKLFLSDKY